MKSRHHVTKIMVLFVTVLMITSCQVVVSQDFLKEKFFHEEGISKPRPPDEISLLSFHGRYIFATKDGNWTIRQEPIFEPCGQFTLRHTWNGKVTLETCHGRFITAPNSGENRGDWMLKQETKPGECGEFSMYELGDDRVAFKTCAGNFFTAGDNGLGWEGELR